MGPCSGRCAHARSLSRSHVGKPVRGHRVEINVTADTGALSGGLESPEGDWRCSCGAAERAYHAGLAFGRRPVEVVALLKAHKLGIWHPPSQAPR